MAEKHQVQIKDWFIVGQTLHGTNINHPELPEGLHIMTSQIVRYDRENGIVETMNSFYKLVGPSGMNGHAGWERGEYVG